MIVPNVKTKKDISINVITLVNGACFGFDVRKMQQSFYQNGIWPEKLHVCKKAHSQMQSQACILICLTQAYPC